MADAMLVSSISTQLPEDVYGSVDARAQSGRVSEEKKQTDSGGDKVSISSQGRALSQAKTKDGQALTPGQVQEVQHLSEVDRKVHVHEQAHVAAGGSLVRGGPNYTYKTGPDGNRYAVGGEVDIDTSPVKGDADATIRKAARIVAAALAPAEPSGQDRAIAAKANKMAQQAQVDKITAQNISRSA